MVGGSSPAREARLEVYRAGLGPRRYEAPSLALHTGAAQLQHGIDYDLNIYRVYPVVAV